MDPKVDRTPWTLAVYVLGLALLGLAIGLILGLSQSAVAETVLTALFVLIGAGAIFYVPWSAARDDASAGATDASSGRRGRAPRDRGCSAGG